MRKGENVISIALAAIVVLTILAIQRKWQPASLEDMASSAQEFILTSTGIRGQVPNIAGYEKVKTYRLGRYRAALYRQSPAPLVFSPGRFVIYDQKFRPVFKLQTLEGSKDSWSEVYDFAGHHGLSVRGSGARPEYIRSLTGNGEPDVVIGLYSGGDHCCTTAEVVELGKDSVSALGRIEGLDGLPFEGLELRKLDKDPSWEFIAHRPVRTICGSHEDAADAVAVYAYTDGRYTDQTARFSSYIENFLRQNLARWAQEKARSLHLLQTLTADYALLGQRDEANRFFAMNLGQFLPVIKGRGVDPNACLDDVANRLSSLPSVKP